VTPLEERIEYKFRNSLLLAEALTHPSLGHEAQRYHFDYQRLEFLGDAVLQLVITEYLFSHFQAEAEGQLTKLRSRLVSRDALRTHAAALDLGRYILMGRGEEASGGRERTSTLADAFEALIGALYLDGGLEVAKNFILTQTRSDLAKLAEEPVDFDGTWGRSQWRPGAYIHIGRCIRSAYRCALLGWWSRGCEKFHSDTDSRRSCEIGGRAGGF